MWEQYRKTAVMTQVVIIAIASFMYFSGRANIPQVAMMFLLMQLGGILGAWWGARINAKAVERDNKLPLE